MVEHPQRCGLCCGDFQVKRPLRIACGHLFHSSCLKAHWDQSALTAVGSCPLCRKRSRRASEVPAANVESKVLHQISPSVMILLLSKSNFAVCYF